MTIDRQVTISTDTHNPRISKPDMVVFSSTLSDL